MKGLVQWFLFNGGYTIAGFVLIWIAGYVATHFIKLWIDKDTTGKRKAASQAIADLADRITDEAVKKYPQIPIWQLVDKIVDELITESGLRHTYAENAINAALTRANIVMPDKIPLKPM